MRFYLEQFKPDVLNVHTIHAETEGMGHLEMFAALIRALKERGAKFIRLDQVATRLNAAELPLCEVIRNTLPGRAGWISAQGPEQQAASSAACVCNALYSVSFRYTERGSSPDSMPVIAVSISRLSPTGSTASWRIRSNASPNRLSCS